MFNSHEPRDRRGRWTFDPTMPAHEQVTLDLNAVRRKAYENVGVQMAAGQHGLDYPGPFRAYLARKHFKLRRLMGRV